MRRQIFYPDFRQLQSWPVLSPGDVVDIVAPAWACQKSELRGAERFLRSWDLVPRVPKGIFADVPMFAQTDAKRFEYLRQALMAPDSKAVWCVRGGYGAIRLLPELARMAKPKTPKLFIGYSDITTLHAFLNSQWRWPTLHGPLLDRFGRGANLPRETREMKGLLFGRRTGVEFTGLKPLNSAARQSRKVIAGVVGGNMAVLQSSLATPWQVNSKGQILFFEDTGERPHRVDRILTQMRQSGYLNGVKAVVFGSLLLGNRRDERLMWNDVIPRFAASVSFPVLAGLPVGHGTQQRPLPFLTKAVLELGRAPSLSVASGAAVP